MIIVLLLIFGISHIFAAACGDVNGDGNVTIVDALLIAQDYVDLDPANYDPSVADVNNSGTITISDALLVAQYYVNLISELNCGPIETDAPTPTPTPTPTQGTEGLVAFPGAEGYGKIATGGRGGEVYEVTNLNSSGSGSLKDAFSKSGRTIVFRVGGTISGGYSVPDNTTVAGQTAPGDGIEINGTLGIGDNTIVRYIRVRTNVGGDAIARRGGDKIILDHVSTSWSGDEVLSIYHCTNVTIQWCMITEAMSSDHQFGGIWGNNYSTYHHNLFAHNTDRNPRIATGAGYNDLRNNVIYNWKNESVYGGEATGQAWDFCTTNVVANYFKPGPGTPTDPILHTRICSPWNRDGSVYGDWYVAENYLVGHPDVTADNWLGVYPRWFERIYDDRAAIPELKLDSPSTYMPIRQETAEEAYLSVLEHAGCSLPNRDSVDRRIIEEVRNGTYTYGNNGFVTKPSDVGGHPSLQNGTPPADSDHDGMPDAWENANGLNPNNANDRNNTDSIGYTMLENYINSLDSF